VTELTDVFSATVIFVGDLAWQRGRPAAPQGAHASPDAEVINSLPMREETTCSSSFVDWTPVVGAFGGMASSESTQPW